MGTKQGNENKTANASLSTLSVPNGTVLTERISVGRTGREWHLPFEAIFDRTKISERSSAVKVEKYFTEDVIARMTCEFLRKHAPEVYRALYTELKSYYPTHPKYPESHRAARDGVKPFPAASSNAAATTDSKKTLGRQAPFTFEVPKLGRDHWAYVCHKTLGNYCDEKSGDEKKLKKAEVKQDTESITGYLEAYRELAKDVRGRNLCKATREALTRSPYLTCMELCVGELHIPSHFLAFVHYGIGLQIMYELSMPWDKRDFPKAVPRKLVSALRESFRTIARLYREDFCS